MTLPSWAREPLVHFLFAGALLYAFFAWSGGSEVDPASRVIDVDKDQQAQLAVQFERVMGRAPTDAELDAQIDRFVRDEVLYREALRLGLDQGDAVVRRRLVAKMDLAAGAAAERAAVDDETLRAYFDSNRDRYAEGTSLTFDQLLFSDEGSARAALGRLAASDGWQFEGERSTLPRTIDGKSMRDVGGVFGEAFARSILELEPGNGWQGPLQSGYGWHVVRLRKRSSAAANFEAIRAQVENDWRSEEIADRKRQAYELLRDAYRIEIDR
ncbi:peptidyl-prolyl cis-trans isomerase [Erythrobacter rubeus]|uniref:peptidylprolyl isomerase n=1 Tax=Erythrobacter rubeus TaxID=2760803 RepID=A0ABR8KK89_9SPHN|nr:peptidyl-prolyl cis-trans isomerase [Erythrobacter rubeus]MBD2840651.1 peptidyl-prolyl cis-trans isomerase [Erythrobacter rubeus]